VTAGVSHSGTKANIIPDEARPAVNLQFHSEVTRENLLDAIDRIVTAEYRSGSLPAWISLRGCSSLHAADRY
jgi:metal-dependent amidase/aminoacylase/carboxypeptidase family protein